MIEESNIMREIHKIREAFYRETKGKSKEYILRRIKEDCGKVVEELANIPPDTRLAVGEKYSMAVRNSMREIHQIREGGGGYGKKERRPK